MAQEWGRKKNNGKTIYSSKVSSKVTFPIFRVQLEPGKDYYWCACGLSKNQPFCDGSHTGSPFQPVKFTPQKDTAHLCMCKQTKDQPYCDKTHMSLFFWQWFDLLVISMNL